MVRSVDTGVDCGQKRSVDTGVDCGQKCRYRC